MTSAMSVQGLSKRFGRTPALDGVSFEVPQGSVFGLLGPNGAGKTTLFSVAAGFLRPTGGRIEVFGIDVREISRLRGRFAMLPQDARFQGGIPVLEQLAMFGRLIGHDLATARTLAMRALEVVGLADVAKRNARVLSHGMMKRVALCQAFLGEPELILLDEPTAGLDPENARRMRDLIQGMRAKQTIVISSHNLREIQDMCDHAAILHEGRLEACASMEELTSANLLFRIRLASALTEAAAADLEALDGVRGLQRTGHDTFNLELAVGGTDARDEAVKAIQRCLLVDHDLALRSFQEGESLEARFLELTGGTYDGSGST